MCRRLAGNEADALDATQEALIAIARGHPALRRARRLLHLGLPGGHQRLPRRAAPPQAARRARACPTTSAPARSSAAAAVAIDVLPDRLAIDAALAELPEEFRAPVVLRDLCDLDYAEIADVLGIPPGTVRSRIARGRAQLARLLEPGEPARRARASNLSRRPPTTP